MEDSADNRLWIARDEDGSLYMYERRPELDKEEGMPGVFYVSPGFQNEVMKLNDYSYPEVTYENSPQMLITLLT